MIHPKNELIDRCKRLGLPKPRFHTKNSGPEHEPIFHSEVTIAGEAYGSGEGGNKREAERAASEEALKKLEQQPTKPTSASQSSALEDFDGPWPIFAEVLAASFQIANSRVDPTLTGEKAIAEVRELALQLYKTSLEDLGDVVELDDE